MRQKPLGSLLLAFLLAISILACGGGSPGSGSNGGGGGGGSAPLDLLPDDTSRLEVLAVSAIVGGGVPEPLERWFDGEWEPYSLGDDIVTGEDIGTLVLAFTRDGIIVLISGSQIDFPGIQDWLADEEANIQKHSYQGQEMWGDEEEGGRAMAILRDDGHIAYGDTGAIKELLKVKARGTGSLAQASENSLKRVYEDARSGWYVMATDDCGSFPKELRACEGYSITAGQGEEDYLVDLSYRFRFRSEARAEGQVEDIEDYLDDTGWDLDLDEVKSDGESVEARASADEEDFGLNWLVSFSRISRPSPLPTAVPEPESRGTSGTTTGSAAGQPTRAAPPRPRLNLTATPTRIPRPTSTAVPPRR